MLELYTPLEIQLFLSSHPKELPLIHKAVFKITLYIQRQQTKIPANNTLTSNTKRIWFQVLTTKL